MMFLTRTRWLKYKILLIGIRGRINRAKIFISRPVRGGTPTGDLTEREICKIALTENQKIPRPARPLRRSYPKIKY